MDYVTKGYEPADALQYFEELSAIPRGSGNEGAVADYICEFAKAHGLEYYRDKVHNVIVKKPGSNRISHFRPVDSVCAIRW